MTDGCVVLCKTVRPRVSEDGRDWLKAARDVRRPRVGFHFFIELRLISSN